MKVRIVREDGFGHGVDVESPRKDGVIGLHDPNDAWSSETERDLNYLVDNAGMTKFINVGEATDANLAKLADWVSDSVSSQSDQVGSNAPSQVFDF